MWHTAHTILRVLAGVAGALSLYAALFLYEDEQGKIQNKLEEWWVGLSDMQSEALSRHTGFMREVARLTTQGFDRLLGPRLLSPSVLMPSSFYSSASLLLCTVVYGFLFHRAYFLHYQPVASLLALGAGLWMGRRTALGRWRNLTATLSLRDLALFFLNLGKFVSSMCISHRWGRVAHSVRDAESLPYYANEFCLRHGLYRCNPLVSPMVL